MINVILALHLMVAVALVGLVLMQRSEGGALGMGGGGGSLLSGRGAADVLARSTSILGAVFFITSISMTMLAGGARTSTSVVDEPGRSPFAPVVEMFQNITKPAAKPSATPAPVVPVAPITPAPALPATTGEIAPAPDSAALRAAPLEATPSVTAPPAVAATKPPQTAAVTAPKPSVTPAPVAPRAPVARRTPSVQVPPATALTSVKPAESSEAQIPAERPRGRAGPDE